MRSQESFRWENAFPWVSEHVDLPSLGDAEASGTGPGQAALHSLAESLVQSRLVHRDLGELFPRARADITIEELRLSVRSTNRLHYAGVATTADLLSYSIRDLLDIRNMGHKSVVEIVSEVARLQLDGLAHGATPDAKRGAGPGANSLGALQRAALERALGEADRDLVTLASWKAVQGRRNEPLIRETLTDPVEVQAARTRLMTLSAAHLLGASGPDAAADLSETIEGFAPSLLVVLTRRLLPSGISKPTLEVVGQELGVSRERVRQIEKAVVEALQESTTQSRHLLALQSAIPHAIQKICPIAVLLEELPALGDEVAAVGSPLWRVFECFSPDFEIVDGWCAVPAVWEVVNSTREHVEGALDETGVVRLETLAGPDWIQRARTQGWLGSWLEYCGFEVIDGFLCAHMGSIGDRAVAALVMAGGPLAYGDLPGFVVADRSESSVKNALAADDRIVRIDRTKWALKSWGIPEYGGIVDAIGRMIDERGGSVPLSELVESLCERFGVAESSVRAYAAGFPYEVDKGVVTRTDKPKESRKSWRQTRRFYAHGDQWLLRITVNSDHLRGSGFQCPVAVAAQLGAEPQTSVGFTNGEDELRLFATGIQPHIGSIKSVLERKGIEEGAEVFLVFGPHELFDLRQVHAGEGDSPLSQACALVGYPDVRAAHECFAKLRAAIGADSEASIVDLWEGYTSRADSDVADLIRAWMAEQGEPLAPAPQPFNDEDRVNDILGLL